MSKRPRWECKTTRRRFIRVNQEQLQQILASVVEILESRESQQQSLVQVHELVSRNALRLSSPNRRKRHGQV